MWMRVWPFFLTDYCLNSIHWRMFLQIRNSSRKRRITRSLRFRSLCFLLRFNSLLHHEFPINRTTILQLPLQTFSDFVPMIIKSPIFPFHFSTAEQSYGQLSCYWYIYSQVNSVFHVMSCRYTSKIIGNFFEEDSALSLEVSTLVDDLLAYYAFYTVDVLDFLEES